MDTTVLLIDDETKFCTSLKIILESAGYDVEIVHTGQAALFNLANHRYDAVLLDMGLPDISGLEVAANLKEKFPDTVVIILTGQATLENAVDSLRSGVYDYLSKPFNPEQLLRTLKRGVEYKRLAKQLNESEKRFYQLARTTSEGIIIYSAGSLLLSNEQLCQMFGYEEKELLGCNFFDLLLDKDSIKAITFQQYPGIIEPFEAIGIRRDKSRFPVELRIKQIEYFDRDAQIATIRDLTAQKQAEEKQSALQQKLADARRLESLGLMAGYVAHDLNNILTGIITYPELLLMELPHDFTHRKEIEMISKAGQRAAAVVDDLLTVARGSSSKKEASSLNALVNIFIDSLECQELCRRYPESTISIQLTGKTNNILCSSIHIYKLLVNLIHNAMEAVQGKGEILITTANKFISTQIKGYELIEPGKYITLQIKDNASGIHPDDQSHIFEPFYSNKVMGRSGTGLGLAVVRNTVHDHGGFIDLESSEHGTLFTFYFPICQQKQKSEPLIHSEKIETKPEGLILIIDDQESHREITSRFLTSLGYNVDAVGNGDEAIELIRNNPVAIILLDLIMSRGASGCEIYKQILQHQPELKAIVISGSSNETDLEQARQLGIKQFIKKPYSLHELSEALKHEM